jgi:hypothetical protein
MLAILEKSVIAVYNGDTFGTHLVLQQTLLFKVFKAVLWIRIESGFNGMSGFGVQIPDPGQEKRK